MVVRRLHPGLRAQCARNRAIAKELAEVNLARLGALRSRGELARLRSRNMGASHLGAAGDRLGVRVQCVQRRLGAETWQRDNRASEGEREALTRPLLHARAVSLAQPGTPGRTSGSHAAEDGPLGPNQGHARGGAASSSQAARPRSRRRRACSRRSEVRQPPARFPATQRGGRQARVAVRTSRRQTRAERD